MIRPIETTIKQCFDRCQDICEWETKTPMFKTVRCDEKHLTKAKHYVGKVFLKPFYKNYRSVTPKTVSLYCAKHIQIAEKARMKSRIKKSKNKDLNQLNLL